MNEATVAPKVPVGERGGGVMRLDGSTVLVRLDEGDLEQLDQILSEEVHVCDEQVQRLIDEGEADAADTLSRWAGNVCDLMARVNHAARLLGGE